MKTLMALESHERREFEQLPFGLLGYGLSAASICVVWVRLGVRGKNSESPCRILDMSNRSLSEHKLRCEIVRRSYAIPERTWSAGLLSRDVCPESVGCDWYPFRDELSLARRPKVAEEFSAALLCSTTSSSNIPPRGFA